MEWLVSIAEWFKRRFVPIKHDASYHPAEAYYGSIYLEILMHHLSSLSDPPLDILEAGCGTARLLVPLAKMGHRLTGIDYHRDSLRLAKINANKANVQAELIYGDLAKELARFPRSKFDAALAIESLHNNRRFLDLISRLKLLIRDGGLLFVTHRTRFYYITQCLAKRRFKDALLVATEKEGRLPKGLHRIYYNWQSSAEIDDIYSTLGMRIIKKQPIGPYSGFKPDALDSVCNPGQLSEPQIEMLREIETRFDFETLMASRYVLVVAQNG